MKINKNPVNFFIFFQMPEKVHQKVQKITVKQPYSPTCQLEIESFIEYDLPCCMVLYVNYD